MFLNPQISILEWFLKEHVTLKTSNTAKKKQFLKIYYHRNIILNVFLNKKIYIC